jgi:hypothetical protein
MTHREDLQRIRNSVDWIFTEAEDLRKKLNQEIDKNTNLENIIKSKNNIIKEKDNIINSLELQITQQEVRMSYLEVGNNIVDEYIK